MRLRCLKLKDAPLMLEWMHDPDIIRNLQADFLSKTQEDCEAFIIKSLADSKNLNLAVTDKTDEYMGTVSLKNIDKENGCAEFAIAMRRSAMGTGLARLAVDEIIHIGMEKLGLQQIYWYVSEENVRAKRFYDKNGYSRVQREEIRANSVQAMCMQSKMLFYAVNK